MPPPSANTSDSTGTIIGSIAFVIVLTVLVVGAIVFCKRRRRQRLLSSAGSVHYKV